MQSRRRNKGGIRPRSLIAPIGIGLVAIALLGRTWGAEFKRYMRIRRM